MAVTEIHDIKKTPLKAIKYIMNPKKALYISGSNCAVPNPSLVHKQFEEVRKHYGKEDKNLQYHLYQSFEKYDEKADPETVHKIGVKLAEKLFYKYQVVVSTHIDKDHIHNHFMINSVSFLDGYKYNDCDKTYADIRKSSDQICKEHGLEILESTTNYSRYANNKKRSVKETDSYYSTSDYRNSETYENNQETSQSFSTRIRNDIDKAVLGSISFDDFIKLMKSGGYEIKHGNVKHIAFKAPEQQRFRRGYTLGDSYTEEAIKFRINENIKSKDKELHSNKDEEKILINADSNIQTSEHIQSSYQLGKKNRNYKYENYRYGKTDIDQLEELYKKVIHSDGTVMRIPRAQIETIFIKDLKNTEAQRKKLRSMLNQNSSSYVIKINKVKEKELIDRINNNFMQLKFIERNEISGFDDIYNKVLSLKNKHQKIRDSLDIVDESIRSMEKISYIISKYQKLSEKADGGVNTDEIKLLYECEKFLLSKNLSSRNEQEDFILKLDKYRNTYVTMKNSDAVIEKKLKEYDILVMTLQYIDQHGKNKNSSNIRQYYSIRNNNIQKR